MIATLACPTDEMPPVETIPGMWMMAWLRVHAESTFVDEMRGKGFPAYCPYVTKYIVRDGKRRKVETPAFAGYAFVVAPSHPDERLQAIYDMRGSQRLSQRTIVPIVNQRLFVEELSQVQRALAIDSELESHSGFTPGRRVRITKGKFIGLEGWVETLDRGLVSLRLSFMNSAIDFETGLDNLELAE